MSAVQGRSIEYGKAFRENAENNQKLVDAQAAYSKAEEQYSKSQMRLAEARRLLLEEAQKV